jgi:hypothetical protein
MTRREAEKKIKEKWGFLPYGGITLSLYEMDDEIPEDLFKYEMERTPYKSPGNFIVTSSRVAEEIDKLLNGDKDE